MHFGCVTLTQPEVARRIADAIKSSALSRDEVARSVGVHPSAVSHWVSGRAVPTVANLVRLAEVLGVDAASLLPDRVAAEEPQQP